MERKAYTKFYNHNLKRIYRYVYFRVGKNRAVAEDLVSDIFMKALEHFDGYDPVISESAWIYRIAHNKVLNYWRDTKPTADIDDPAMASSLTGIDERGRLNQKLDIESLLGQLSEEERELVTLKYLSGYKYSTIAQALGKSADAVKVATHRAMQKLKALCSPSKL